MWELIMNMMSSNNGSESSMGGSDSAMGGNESLGSTSDKLDNVDLKADDGQGMMDKVGSFGKEQFGSEFSPYVNGIKDLKNIYSQFKSGNGLLGTNAGSQDPTALSSAARLFGDNGLLGGNPGMTQMNQMPQISVMQNGGLGMPSANVQSFTNRPVQPMTSNLARQAFGSFY